VSQRLALLKQDAPEYTAYPHEVFGLPSEVVKRARMPAKDLLGWFVREYKARKGCGRRSAKLWSGRPRVMGLDLLFGREPMGRRCTCSIDE